MNFSETVQQQFDECIRLTKGGERVFREHAWAEYERLGLPGRQNEAWKYTGVANLNRPWDLPDKTDTPAARVVELLSLYARDFDCVLLLNGQPQPPPPGLGATGVNFTLRSLDHGLPLQYEDGFFSVAAALNRGGFEIEIASGRKVDRPLLIVHAQTGEGSWNPSLNRLRLGKETRLNVAEIFIGEDSNYLRTDITHVQLGVAAQLNWVRVQEENAGASFFGEVQARLEGRAQLSLTQANCGADWTRSSLKVDIVGALAEAHINGLSFGREQQHVDQRVVIQHLAGHSHSSQLFKGILKDRARGVLNGKIYIARHAQKVNSSQLNHNLLLSPGAEADTKPELEIYADDVKANHGASIGRLDEEKLFYLLSRGIPQAQAEQMLARAFADDVVLKIPEARLRHFLSDRVAKLLPEFGRVTEGVK